MQGDIVLRPGEKLLLKAPVSLVTGRLATRTGVCYLTTQRIVVVSEAMMAGVAAGLSIIARTVLRKVGQLGTQKQEVALRELRSVELQKYGINQTVNIPLSDGSQARIVFSAKTRQRFFQMLDDALRAQGLQRMSEGENIWRVRPLP